MRRRLRRAPTEEEGAALSAHSISSIPADRLASSKARRVYLQLRDDISSGVYPAGTSLPGEPRLADRLGVSRVTVRRALERLAEERLVVRRPGSGTIVTGARQDPAIRADVATLMPQLVEMGRRTTARLLSFAYVAPPPMIEEALGLEPGEAVQRAVRVRSLPDGPFSHLTTHVPAAIASAYSEADLATTPLFRLLERGGARIASATQSVSATLASPEVAEALDVAAGAALISINRIVLDAEGQGVEHLQALYRPDRFRFEMELARVGSGDARHWSPVLLHGGRSNDGKAADGEPA